MNQLAVIQQLKPLDIFTHQGTSDILDKIKKEARSHVLDISTKDGREHIRSLAHTIVRSKTLLDDMGKELVAEQKKQLAQVDAERKRIRDELDSLKEEIRAPLTEWENAEKERVQNHESELVFLSQCATYAELNDIPAVEIERLIAKAQEIYTRDWQEFAARAAQAKDDVIARLGKRLEARRKFDAEQAELERLRREDAERKQREHEERIKAEAAAKAKAEAEAKAKAKADAEAARVMAEQEKAEKERQRLQREKEAVEKEKAEAESRARKAEEERLAALKAAEEARIAAVEQAERDKAVAAEKAKRDAKVAAEKADREKEAAVQAERDRVQAARKAEEEAAAKREADKKHRAKVNNEVLNGIVTHCNFETVDITPEIAKVVVEAIAKGLIPHVKINY